MRIHDGSGGGNPVSAKTVFMPLGSWKAFCLLDAHLLTGRTHQIRVHLASVAHPILGDDKYGDADRDKPLKKLGIRRLMLHSFSLRFQHPGTGEPMSIEAPLPPDFQAFITRLEARADEERLLRTLKGPDAQPI
jgi:23S rRNA pseudouridine955/2504/2580 synthase